FAFGPGGNLLPDGGFGQLTWDAGTAGHRPFDPRRDSYNHAPDNYLRTPYERVSLFAQARRDIAAGVGLRGELLLQQRRSGRELAPTPIFQYGAGGIPNQSSIDSGSVHNP